MAKPVGENRKRMCGAKTRAGTPCKRAPLANGRCKLHGGNVTGNQKQNGTQKALKFGFFSRIFPDDPEINDILKSIVDKDPIDVLWENIVIQYTAICRAQKIMYVQNRDDESVFTSMRQSSEMGETEMKQIQYAWDKQANFMNAQSRAMTTLEQMLVRYMELLPEGTKMQKQKMEIEKMKAEIDKIKNGGNTDDVVAWIEAVQAVAERRKQSKVESDG